MGKDSGIQWTDHTFNCWRGCTRVSEACRFCYAETLSKRNPSVLGEWGPQGSRVIASEAMWENPLKWNWAAKLAGQRHRVFCASLADVFEEWSGPMVTSKGNPFWWCHGSMSNSPIPSTGLTDGCRLVTMDDIRERLFQLILDTPNLDWLLLTKRPEIAKDYLVTKSFGGLPFEWGDGLPNVWLGATVENKASRSRIKTLLEIPAAIHWLSCEPLLEEIDISDYLYIIQTRSWREWPHGHIDWVICGGESGSKRHFDLQWARSLRDQCRESNTPFFMKQMGANPVETIRIGLPDFKIIDLEDSHGGEMAEWPEDLRIREFPTPHTKLISG